MSNGKGYVGSFAPPFEIECVDRDGNVSRVSLKNHQGRWLALMFYPRDFSFVCPTELSAASAKIEEFQKRNCDFLAISIDTIATHQEWITTPEANGGVGKLRFPLGSDPDGNISQNYGVWNEEMDVANRGLFLIDPDGKIQYAVVHSLGVGRNIEEFIRVLDAIQTGGLCPTSWTSADGTIDVNKMLKTGRVLGHYKILEQLGRGAFGSVHLANDLRLEREVAIKIVHQTTGEQKKKLLSEARSAAGINHPNVCTVYTVDEIDGLPVIVMEYLQGLTLDKRRQEPLDERSAHNIAVGIAGGLAAAHHHHVVHGDLKPANILISQDDHPKIVDFGLARSKRDPQAFKLSPVSTSGKTAAAGTIGSVNQWADLSETIDTSQTEASHPGFSGTPMYMAPEHTRGLPPSEKTDVFALGLIVYELITGRAALDDLSINQILNSLADEGFVSKLPQDVRGLYKGLLHSTLEFDPENRATAEEALQYLQSIRV